MEKILTTLSLSMDRTNMDIFKASEILAQVEGLTLDDALDKLMNHRGGEK